MFKKKCPKCNKKIEKNFEFCPHCGNNLKKVEKEEDYGFLGKNDFDNPPGFVKVFNDSMIDKVFRSAEKIVERMMEKQLKNFPKELKSHPNKQNNPFNNLDVQFFINGKKVNFANNPSVKKLDLPRRNISKPVKESKARLIAKLPKIEPESKIRRLSGRLIYEISIPGVKDIEDILINALENSIEIKALADKKVYSKIINVNFPIIGYKLADENLILELQTK